MNKHIDLNNGWEFTETFSEEFLQGGGEGVTSVRLPHTFVETPYDYFDESSYQAVCGYRRTLTVPVEWTGKRILLTVDGAAHYAEVYLDGQMLAAHRSGYTAFRVNLSHAAPGDQHTAFPQPLEIILCWNLFISIR